MKKKLFYCFCLVNILLTTTSSAMHIMEGFLDKKWALFWAVLCIPFVLSGFKSLKKYVEKDPKNKMLIAMVGAFAFVLSALKIPSVTGSCSHPTGVGLGAILFGPSLMSVLGLIVLLFQALLLAHGGITTLGANLFSMGIAGPIVSYYVYKAGKKLKMNTSFSIFLAATLGDLFTYIVTSIQLSLAYMDKGFMFSFTKFISIFAVTQIPLAISEGLLTVLVFNLLTNYNKDKLQELGVINNKEMI